MKKNEARYIVTSVASIPVIRLGGKGDAYKIATKPGWGVVEWYSAVNDYKAPVSRDTTDKTQQLACDEDSSAVLCPRYGRDFLIFPYDEIDVKEMPRQAELDAIIISDACGFSFWEADEGDVKIFVTYEENGLIDTYRLDNWSSKPEEGETEITFADLQSEADYNSIDRADIDGTFENSRKLEAAPTPGDWLPPADTKATAQYAIFEGNLEKLQKKLTRISNKCSKFGCSFSYTEVGEVFREVEDDQGQTVTLRFVLIEAEGVARLNGWRFIASVEYTTNGNIINRAAYDVEVPERYYKTATFCEHCKTNRARRDTFIVMNESTGEFKQVGRSCLADFTGGLSAGNIASYYSYFDELVKGEAVDFGGDFTRYYDKLEMLHFFAETIRKFGFVKRTGEGLATADRAYNYYAVTYNEWLFPKVRQDSRNEMDAVGFNPNSPEAVNDTEAALMWLETQDATTNYMHNLKTLCGMEYVSGKNFGILASLFPTWKRETAKADERKERQQTQEEQRKRSTYVGEVGERLRLNIVSFECVTSWETDWGITHLYKMTDASGNVLIWKSSKWVDTDPLHDKESAVIVGTVKAHSEYNGTAQTELSRCKIT